MADIQSAAAEIRRGKKRKKKEEEERTNHSMKIYMVSLLHRATIKKPQDKNIMSASATQGGHNNVNKYRPVTPVCIRCKTLEFIIRDKVMEHLPCLQIGSLAFRLILLLLSYYRF